MEKSFYQLKEDLKSKKTSCEEIMKKTLNQIEEFDIFLESFVIFGNKDELINRAALSDKRWRENKPLSDIDGLPIIIADNIHDMNYPTTCGSKMLSDYMPIFESTIVKRIKEAGGIVVGKSTTLEFDFGSTEHISVNPYNTKLSTIGAASGVALDMGVLSVSLDTGKNRFFITSNNQVSFLPTPSLVSGNGVVSNAPSLDRVSFASSDLSGAATLLNILKGEDRYDSSTYGADNLKLSPAKEFKSLKIASIKSLPLDAKVKNSFNKALSLIKNMGITVDEVDFDLVSELVATYKIIAFAESSSSLGKYDGVNYGFRASNQVTYNDMLFDTRDQGFGFDVKREIMLGNLMLSSVNYDKYFKKAQKVRTLIKQKFDAIFEKYDLVILPAFNDLNLSNVDYPSVASSLIANLIGSPSAAIPVDTIDDTPFGIELVGKQFSDLTVIGAADKIFSEVKIDKNIDPKKIKALKKREKRVIIKKKEFEEVKESIKYSSDDIKKISDSYNAPIVDSRRVLSSKLPEYIGKEVVVKGWIHKIQKLGGIEFIVLRDRGGFTQVVFENNLSEKLHLETVIDVHGTVVKEPKSPFNGIEVRASKIKILGHSNAELPISINGKYEEISLPVLLDDRMISVRMPKILTVFKIQSEIVRLFGEFLRNNDFTEIKTSKIVSSGTEGGSNVFELKYFDRAAFLAQSPQFYKQTMVGSGFERVFEVGPVFRAEIHNTIRHLNEYVSLDFEMGFIDSELTLVNIQESLIKYILTNIKEKYGTLIKDVFGEDIVIPEKFPKIHFIEALDIAAREGVKDLDGDLSPEGERTVCDYIQKRYDSPFVYILGYPIKKRPVYAMPDERLPGYTRSFDLLYKGLEITTGGQRIHEYEMLKNNMIDFGVNPESFKEYLSVFKFGMCPHGGLGMGLERFTMKLLGLSNVREACLFPRDIGRVSP